MVSTSLCIHKEKKALLLSFLEAGDDRMLVIYTMWGVLCFMTWDVLLPHPSLWLVTLIFKMVFRTRRKACICREEHTCLIEISIHSFTDTFSSAVFLSRLSFSRRWLSNHKMMSQVLAWHLQELLNICDWK